MIRLLNPQIAIILVAMTAILAVPQVRGQAMSSTARAVGTPAATGATNPSDKQESKSAPSGSSAWTAGATSFASSAKGAWGGSQGFSSTPKAAWTASSNAFREGAVQRGVWRTRPSFSTPEGATSTNPTQAESVSTPPAGLQPYAMDARHGSASRISKPATKGASISGVGTHQSGISARRFAIPLQGKAGGKPAFGISGQRNSFAGTRFEGMRSMRGSQSGLVGGGKHGMTGLGDRPGALSPGPVQHRLGSSLGRTTDSTLDPNHP
jgi:hypothetical protein